MKDENLKSVAIIVAQPDEETLWAARTILSHPMWKCFVVCLTKANDPELSARFSYALKLLKSEGTMGRLDEIQDSNLFDDSYLESEIVHLLPNTHFDLITTYIPTENTDNEVHRQVYKAVVGLMDNGIIDAQELWTFTTDENGLICEGSTGEKSDVQQAFTTTVFKRKYNIISSKFGQQLKELDQKRASITEAFWQYKDSFKSKKDLKYYGYGLNIFRAPTIEALKFIYHKSVSVVSDIDGWMLRDAPCVENESNDYLTKDKASYKYFGKDLKIFQRSTIESLKNSYYQHLTYLFDRNFWKSTNETDDSRKFDVFNFSEKKNCQQKSVELNIFKATSIDSLKLLYKKSLWSLAQNPILDTLIVAGCDDLNVNSIGSNTDELKIFKCLSVDYLKSLYYGDVKK